MSTNLDFKVSQTYAGHSDNNTQERMQEALTFAGVLQGTGTPEGAVVANVGALFMRLDGGANTTLYVKESGAGLNTGWVAK